MSRLAFIERAASWYLSRWSTTRAHLRKLLMKRVQKRVLPEEHAAAIAEVEAVLDRCERAGLVDDAAYAESKVARMIARGVSAPVIRARLAAKGLTRIAMPDDAAFTSCCAYVLRRRLGPLRDDAAAHREKDLARIGRAGFSYEIARRVLAMDPDEIRSVTAR